MRFQVLRAFLEASGVQFGHAIGEKRPEDTLGNLECMELPEKKKIFILTGCFFLRFIF